MPIRDRVTGNKMQVLKIVGGMGEADTETISRKMIVSPEFVKKLCESLVKNGYLSEVGEGKYKLTPEAERVLNPYRTTGPMGIGRRAAALYPTLPPPG